MKEERCGRGVRLQPWVLLGLGGVAVVAAVWLLGASLARSGESAGPPGAAGEAWLARVTETLAAREYEASIAAAGLQAPNRAQGLRTYFREGGVDVAPRAATKAGWSWSWRTRAWGRTGRLTALDGMESPVVDGVRVEYSHPGLREWYANGPEGIEQGFTLSDRPAGEGLVRIEGMIRGTLRPTGIGPDESVEFLTSTGHRVLRYGGLVVKDARDRELPAALELADGSITIAFDDTGAHYPVVVDPVLTTPDWTYYEDHAYINLGQVVCTAGDVNGDGYSDVLVSATDYDSGGYANNGKVWVFHGSPSGPSDTPDWSKIGDQLNGFLGQTAGTAGDVNGDGYDDVIIGSQNYAHGESYEGRAWLYYGSATGLEATAAWDVESNQTNAYLGFALGTAGDVNGDGYSDVFVTLEGATNGQSGEGIVWVYYGASGGIDETVDWIEEGDQAGASFGHSADWAGDVNGDGYDDLVVSALYYLNPSGFRGRVFVFYGSAGGLGNTPWTVEAPASSEWFGYAVAGAGDVNGDGYADLLIGAPTAGTGGKVYLHLGAAAGPATTPDWTRNAPTNAALFGDDLGTAGDVNGDGYADVIIGAQAYSDDFDEEGAAYLYLGRSTGLPTSYNWFVAGGQEQSGYGRCVGTAGDVNGDGLSDIVVGASGYESDPDYPMAGRVFLYYGANDPPVLYPSAIIEGNQSYAYAGSCIAPAGDVNSDGFSDVLVSADAYDNGEANEGVVFLFLGGPQGMATSAVWYAESNQTMAHLGRSCAGAGDVNGDGLIDVIVGAPYYDGTQTDEGAAFVWLGRTGTIPMGNPSNADWSAYGGQASAHFGHAVASAGDVNGDGFADVAVGAPEYDDGQTDEGGTFGYYGSEDGLPAVRSWYRDADHTGAAFGSSVSSAGDFNGDGYSDLIVGSPKYDHPSVDEGLATVYHGSASGLTNGAPFWFAQGDEAEGWLGYCVACAGDVNGDGYSDVIIGAPQISTPNPNGGNALIWYGGPTAPPSGTPSTADHRIVRLRDGARLGWHVDSAGDLDSDGYSDILVGSPYQAGVGDAWGVVYAWYGGPSGPVGAAVWLAEGLTTFTGWGASFAGVGDVNGDGFGDVMLGATNWENPDVAEGAVFLYYGNNSRGLARAPMQWQSDGSAPIPPLGWSESPSQFALRGLGRTAAGRGHVRIVYEVKEHLDLFDGTGQIAGSWWDTGTPVVSGGSRVTIFRQVGGLTADRQHHWRFHFESRNPYFPRTPWFYLPDNGGEEADLRTQANSDAPLVGAESGLFLAPCTPNPVIASTVLRYRLPAAGPVRLALFDVQGRRVAQLIDEPSQAAGEYAVRWDGRDDGGRRVSPGVYFCRLDAAGETRSEKVLVSR